MSLLPNPTPKLGVSDTTYVDTRIVTIGADIYTAYDGYGNTVATNMYGTSEYNTDLNSAVTQVDWGREDQKSLQIPPACLRAPFLTLLISPNRSRSWTKTATCTA